MRAGTMIHIHARTPDGGPSFEVEDYKAISDAIRNEVGDAAIVNFSTGAVGVSVEKRIAYLRECRPEVAALNMGSMNYAKYSRSRKDFVFKMVFANPFEEIIELLRAMSELGIKPEHECFDIGHIGSLEPLIDMGVLKAAPARRLHHGRNRRHPPECTQPGRDGRQHPGCRRRAGRAWRGRPGRAQAKSHWAVIGISRQQWLLGGRRTDPRWLGARGARGQPVSAEWRDGALQRRARRQGASDERRHRPPARHRAGGPRNVGNPHPPAAP